MQLTISVPLQRAKPDADTQADNKRADADPHETDRLKACDRFPERNQNRGKKAAYCTNDGTKLRRERNKQCHKEEREEWRHQQRRSPLGHLQKVAGHVLHRTARGNDDGANADETP